MTNLNKIKNRAACFAISMLLVLFLGGCAREKLVSDLNQKQAHEVVATLASQGIITKITQARGSRGASYQVEVSSGDYALAISILHALGLPREAQPTFREMTEQKGFLPNSREIEAARLDYALGGEIEEKLKLLNGVDSVSAIVRSNLIKHGDPSASLMIAASEQASLDPQEIVKIVTMVVPGLQPSRVAILIQKPMKQSVQVSSRGVTNQDGRVVYRTLVPFFGTFLIPEGDSQRLSTVMLGIIAFSIVVAFLAGFLFSGRRGSKNQNSIGGGISIAKLAVDRTAGRSRLVGPADKSEQSGDL
jgi:type III secretory pathway lipoprotein EscJ